MKRFKSSGRLLGAATAGCATLLATHQLAGAATFRWDGEGSSVAWTDPANWDNNGSDGVPGSGDTVLFDNTFVSPIPLTALGGDRGIATLAFDTANTVDIRANVAPTTTARTLVLNGDGSEENLLIHATGGGSFSTNSTNTAGTFSGFSLVAGASGTIRVDAGSTFTVNNNNNLVVASGRSVTISGGGTVNLIGGSSGMSAGSTLVLEAGTLRAHQTAIGAATLYLGSDDPNTPTLGNYHSTNVQTYSGEVFLRDKINFGITQLGTTNPAAAVAFSGPTTLLSDVQMSVLMSTVTFSNGITDGDSTFGITKGGAGTMVIAATSNPIYKGGTTVTAGTFSLLGKLISTSNIAALGGTFNVDMRNDPNANPTNPINPAATLMLGGGTFNVLGKSSGMSSQTLANPSFVGGASTITLTPAGTGTVNLTLGNTWTRSTGATALFNLTIAGSKAVMSNPALTNGIVGYALVNDGTYGFATVSGGQIVRYTGATPLAGFTDANTNYTFSGTLFSSLIPWAVNSLELTNASTTTLNLGGTLSLTSGAILQRGSGAVNISGGQLGDTNSEVIYHHRGSANATINSIISGGTGAFTKTGTGTVILTGENTYTGGTYITGGTVQIGANGTAGSIAGDVVLSNSANLTIARSDNYEFAGNVSGNGTITKSNSGSTLTLSGNNLHTGGTIISGGTLVIGSDTALGTGPLGPDATFVTLTTPEPRTFSNTLLLGPTLGGTTIIPASSAEMAFGAIAQGNTGPRTLQLDHPRLVIGTFSANGLSNAAFVKTGEGALIVTGNNAYNGVQTISVGTLAIGGSLGTASRQVLNGGVLATNGTITRLLGNVANTIQWTNSGGFAAFGNNPAWGGAGNNLTVNLAGGAELAWASTANFLGNGHSLLLGSPVANGTVTIANGLGLGAAERTISVARSGTASAGQIDAVIAGVISGAGGSLLKDGDGVLSLTANNTFDGGVNIAAGTLLVNNTAGIGIAGGSHVVQNGATLGGSGRIAGDIAVHGTLAPGNSTGILTADHAVTFEPTATFAVEVNGYTPGTQHDQLHVGSTGSLNLGGSLAITMGLFEADGSPVYLIRNESLSPTLGAFAGLPEGGLIASLSGMNGMDWFITYTADFDNDLAANDVAIYASPVPEPGMLSLLAVGGVMLLRRRRRV